MLDYTFDFFNYAGIHRPVVIYSTPKKSHIDDITIITSSLSKDYSSATVSWVKILKLFIWDRSNPVPTISKMKELTFISWRKGISNIELYILQFEGVRILTFNVFKVKEACLGFRHSSEARLGISFLGIPNAFFPLCMLAPRCSWISNTEKAIQQIAISEAVAMLVYWENSFNFLFQSQCRSYHSCRRYPMRDWNSRPERSKSRRGHRLSR